MGIDALHWRVWAWWLLPIVVLSSLLAWELQRGRNAEHAQQQIAGAAAKPMTVAVLPEYAMGGLDAHKEMVARTLFNPTRRPAPVLAVEPSKSHWQFNQFALSGTTIVGDRRTAFLRESASGKVRMVRQGDEINGAKVAEILPTKVTLKAGDEAEEIAMKTIAGPKTTILPPPPQPSAPTAAQQGQPVGGGGLGAGGGAPGATPAEAQQLRRRAARQAEGVSGGAAPTQAAPVPAAPVVPQPSTAQAAPNQSQPSPEWNAVFQRMMESNAQQNFQKK